MSRLTLAVLGLVAAHVGAALLLVRAGAAGQDSRAPAPPAQITAPPAAPETKPPEAPDPFARYLEADQPVADGFDFPVGDADGQGAYTDPATGKTHHGFYVATRFGDRISLGLHPGEDWNGRGGGNTDEGQPVHAAAAGRVVHVSQGQALWGGAAI